MKQYVYVIMVLKLATIHFKSLFVDEKSEFTMYHNEA